MPAGAALAGILWATIAAKVRCRRGEQLDNPIQRRAHGSARRHGLVRAVGRRSGRWQQGQIRSASARESVSVSSGLCGSRLILLSFQSLLVGVGSSPTITFAKYG